MQQLLTTKRVFIFLYLCPVDDRLSIREKSVQALVASVIFFLNLSFFGVHVTSTIEYLPISYEDSLFVFISAVGIFGVIYTMMTAFFSRHQISAIFSNLTEINETCKCIIHLKTIRKELRNHLKE